MKTTKLEKNDGFRASMFCGIGACVEVKIGKRAVAVRQSSKPDKIVNFSRKEWAAFLKGVKGGEFNI
ncbi:MAG: hypothetical protein A3J47_01740 [Candidatus Yanofskybacteria bacterium RIFCSPHIGHO2_02_FULL_43_22]|uniref:DUF397 domain-containing protein n=1 Tax=Candidatus Yanofskybacteria bacterium RIFCSPHIGHO2_02_FULL_43_22 TaxID=1802681 RepID=A0A1F8FPQ4_9BACT|nr:MAG: hypothetical protein A3J47_01740 [Candidatus Yanofskybacteria bacterium RIFCSPHIGHO2_02_FULL_43_22]